MQNPITFADRYKFGEKLLRTTRRNYPLRSYTRCWTYSPQTKEKGVMQMQHLHEQIDHERDRVKKFRGSYFGYISRMLRKDSSSQMVGNCNDFTDIAEAIAKMNPQKNCNCFQATIRKRNPNNLLSSDALDHNLLILVDDKTASSINNYFKAKRKNPNAKISVPRLNKQNTVVVDPWADFVSNVQQAKVRYKSFFSKAFRIPQDHKIFIVPTESPTIKKQEVNIIKEQFPNLKINVPDNLQPKEKSSPIKQMVHFIKNIFN